MRGWNRTETNNQSHDSQTSSSNRKMALVWFVDKFPRSRRPVQYRRLEDFSSGGSPSDDLLPILLPCALCCAQQQMSASLVAHHLQRNRKRHLQKQPEEEKATKETASVIKGTEESSQYSEFLQLCQHVECMVEKSMARMKKTASTVAEATPKKSCSDDDMRQRSLRDANRATMIKQMDQESMTSTNNHYVWMDQSNDKYKSRFFPMRNHDLVGDDLAVRRWVKVAHKPPLHPNHRNKSSGRKRSASEERA